MNAVTIDARNTAIGLCAFTFQHFIETHCVDPDLMYEITIRMPSNEIVTLQCNKAFLENPNNQNGLRVWYDFVNGRENKV